MIYPLLLFHMPCFPPKKKKKIDQDIEVGLHLSWKMREANEDNDFFYPANVSSCFLYLFSTDINYPPKYDKDIKLCLHQVGRWELEGNFSIPPISQNQRKQKTMGCLYDIFQSNYGSDWIFWNFRLRQKSHHQHWNEMKYIKKDIFLLIGGLFDWKQDKEPCMHHACYIHQLYQSYVQHARTYSVNDQLLSLTAGVREGLLGDHSI